MQFQVPQFIEREMKIVGPFTFKQFLFVGGGGFGIIFLYLTLAARNFFLFILLSGLIIAVSLALAFGKIRGIKLTTLIINFFSFITSSRTYIWKKKAVSPRLVYRTKPKEEDKEEEKQLKLRKRGRLEGLATKLEIGLR